MYWKQIQGRWLDYRGRVKQRWATLSEQDLTTIDGRRDVLADKLLAHSETTKEQVEQQIDEFETACQQPGEACTQEGARLRTGPAADMTPVHPPD
jgi:uncharacterized protein YjbJ (UPF0337 family)